MTTTVCHDIARTDYAAVETFIERLSMFAIDDWLAVAATCGDQTAEIAALRAFVAKHGLSVEAWSVADDVETAVHCSVGTRGFAVSREGALLRLARQAASVAALALLMRPVLRAAEVERLCRPFAPLLPLATNPAWPPRVGKHVTGEWGHPILLV